MRQFGQTVVEDRLVLRDATHTHAHAEPKSVFSYATAVMDKIEGWEEEEENICNGQRKHARVLDAKVLILHGRGEMGMR